jgi:hypothetical protein
VKPEFYAKFVCIRIRETTEKPAEKIIVTLSNQIPSKKFIIV